MSKLLIITIVAIAFVALTGVANASTTVKIDKVQINGIFHGIPKLLPGGNQAYGYEYTLVPDGTYTIFGTITNDGNAPVKVRVGGGTLATPVDVKVIDVPAPANGAKSNSVGYTLTFWAGTNNNVRTGYWVIAGEDTGAWNIIDLSHVDFVEASDNNEHTVNQGPMSDAIVIFTNGVPTYNGKPVYSVSLGQ